MRQRLRGRDPAAEQVPARSTSTATGCAVTWSASPPAFASR
ncbi:hypothetical protein I553_1717 [Mycobacterium xenopi 4042]|uniref:Uncharacterized protein n=1 Tax=Mycobacterium xenopi 4042 TaxID=1299334 RepID=X8APF9_MYCXE|nr:hypothetical protein I553_1717 [Mycobacterium xenopi 4042]